MRNRLFLWVPLALFAFFAGLAGYMLTQEKSQFVESTMIGQPLPEFALQPAFDGLPGAAKAESWIKDAERYRKAMEALEVIETAAVLDQRGLRDGAGNLVRQSSPLVRP